MISPEHEGNSAMFLAGWPHGNFNVLAEGGQKVHEPFDGEVAGLPTHQTGNMRLPDAQDRACLCLCESPILDQPVDLERKPLSCSRSGLGKPRSAKTLPLPSLTRIVWFFFISVVPLSIVPFRRGEPLFDEFDFFPRRGNTFLGLLLKGVQ